MRKMEGMDTSGGLRPRIKFRGAKRRTAPAAVTRGQKLIIRKPRE